MVPMSESAMNVAEVVIAGQQSFDDGPFPLVFACDSPVATWQQANAWIAAHRDELLPQAAAHGAILFRGFPLVTAEDFIASWRRSACRNFLTTNRCRTPSA